MVEYTQSGPWLYYIQKVLRTIFFNQGVILPSYTILTTSSLIVHIFIHLKVVLTFLIKYQTNSLVIVTDVFSFFNPLGTFTVAKLHSIYFENVITRLRNFFKTFIFLMYTCCCAPHSTFIIPNGCFNCKHTVGNDPSHEGNQREMLKH